MSLVIVILMLALTGLAHFLPAWTRRELFFAVTVDPDFRGSEPAHRILWDYRAVLWTSTIAAIVLFLTTGFVGALIVQIGGLLVSVAIAHHRSLGHTAPQGAIIEVDLSAPPETLPGRPLSVLLPSASLLILALWASRHWNRLPLRIPVRWGFSGANRWVLRTDLGVYGFLATLAAMSLSLTLVAWGILHWSRRSSVDPSSAARDRRFRRLILQMLLLVSFFPAVNGWVALLRPDAVSLLLGTELLLVIGYFIRMVLVFRNLVTPQLGDRTPDACWKLGIFYFNPADPSIFVRKRFGIGYSFNFGNRWSWAILAVVIAIKVARAFMR